MLESNNVLFEELNNSVTEARPPCSSDSFSIFCDESCHLESDSGAMALGGIVVPTHFVYNFNSEIRELKRRYQLSTNCELKWTKISPSGLGVYTELVNYFFSNPNITFRAVVIPDKSKLNHKCFNQTHDTWYYKMYFILLSRLIECGKHNNIYLDIKDTKSSNKVRKLQEILRNNELDFDRSIISKLQNIRSHEVELMSIVDVLIGALTYYYRGFSTSETKRCIIKLIQEKSGLSNFRTTLLSQKKFNLLIWNPQEI